MTTEISNLEFTKRVQDYVNFDSLPEGKKALVTMVTEEILDLLSDLVERNKYTACTFKIYEIDENALFNKPEIFNCFLIDNILKVMFSNVYAAHKFLRPLLMVLYLIKYSDIDFDQLAGIGLKHDNELCDIYTGLNLGIYESGAWGGSSLICGQDYPFHQLNQKRLATAPNLRPVRGFSKAEAEKELASFINKLKSPTK